MIKHLTDLMMFGSDHLGDLLNKFINAFGALSIGAGAAVGVISSSGAIVMQQSETWLSPDYVMAASMFGSICFGLKYAYDLITSAIDRWKAGKSKDEASE